jgi:hypothetical protein
MGKGRGGAGGRADYAYLRSGMGGCRRSGRRAHTLLVCAWEAAGEAAAREAAAVSRDVPARGVRLAVSQGVTRSLMVYSHVSACVCRPGRAKQGVQLHR